MFTIVPQLLLAPRLPQLISTDPVLKGVPERHAIPVREVLLSVEAEFVVVVCGEILTMPGLPRVPAANAIRINDEGLLEGLF